MIKSLRFFLFVISLIGSTLHAQENRIQQLETKLETIVIDSPGLLEKVDLNVNQTNLTTFLQAIANTHKINLNIAPALNQINLTNNFSNATVSDVLVWLCKEYNLEIGFTGNILSIKKLKEKEKPKKKIRPIQINYDTNNDLFSIDLKQDTLYVAFKKIMDKTNKNLVFAPGMANLKLTNYIKNMPFDGAMDKIAFANGLAVSKTRDDYYLFEKNEAFVTTNNTNTTSNSSNKNKPQRPRRNRRSNFYFKVNEKITKNLDIDFENTPISSIVYDIGQELDINMFTSAPLDEAGNATVKAKNISFDLVLDKVFENTEFTYKKQDSLYFFGKKTQLSLRNAVVIPLMHRSIEVMNASGGGSGQRQAGRTNQNSFNGNNTNNNNSNTNNGFNNTNSNANNRQNLNTNRSSSFSSYSNNTEALINILPADVLQDLEVKIDMELNSFIVSGPSQNIERFRAFIKTIDKPVPVIMIEVLVIEINKTATVETGISAGIGDAPAVTQGGIFPSTDLTLGATTVNRIISNFNGFGSLNLGKVVPNFYVQIKALETNGNLKIKSSPKLSTLNGHRANLSIGETTYYAVTQRNVIGTQNPQTSEITNYQPIDAEFAINIKPLVSGDGQITLDINVIQSNFNGTKIAVDAPPGINSREFNSIIRVKDQDLIVLGGLEEKIKNDSGSGIPFLARIPIIKWFFSKKKREDTKKKLTVLIKPTIIR